MTRRLRPALWILTLALSACGFHLRGSDIDGATLAFRAVYIQSSSETALVQSLHRAFRASKIPEVQSPAEADLILDIVQEYNDKQVLSLSGAGRVREYELAYHVSLRAYDKQQREWLPAEEIMMTRILPYDDTQILAKEQEEAMLLKDMRNDVTGQIVRRLQRAKPLPPVTP